MRCQLRQDGNYAGIPANPISEAGVSKMHSCEQDIRTIYYVHNLFAEFGFEIIWPKVASEQA